MLVKGAPGCNFLSEVMLSWKYMFANCIEEMFEDSSDSILFWFLEKYPENIWPYETLSLLNFYAKVKILYFSRMSHVDPGLCDTTWRGVRVLSFEICNLIWDPFPSPIEARVPFYWYKLT